MSYALSFSEPVAQAVDAVRREQLEAAAEEVRARDVHEARKRLKKTRALLRRELADIRAAEMNAAPVGGDQAR